MIRRLFRDRSGTSAIEFAIALPVLILLFTGGFQISDAVSAYRKVTVTSRALADLTSQFTEVTDTDLQKILNASTQVMAPYSIADATFTISQIETDALGRSTVTWSSAKNATPLAVGAAFNLPTALAITNGKVIVARVTYTYRPVFGSSYVGTIPMGDTIIMLPRASDSISKG